jgi:hypothetical protein
MISGLKLNNMSAASIKLVVKLLDENDVTMSGAGIMEDSCIKKQQSVVNYLSPVTIKRPASTTCILLQVT